MLPSTPFQFHFLDDHVEKQYEEEITAGGIINAFAGTAILFSCFIRKVGANTFTLTRLLSKDFVRLVLVAIVIATPLSYCAASKWLQGYVYRIDVSWWIFCAVGYVGFIYCAGYCE